jgi:phosphomannomutase
VHALLAAGVIEKADEGIVFPYDRIHVDFTLNAMAS